MSEKKDKPKESPLAAQLGSDIIDLKTGKVDMRRLSKTGPIDKAWIAYFIMLEPEEGGDFARQFCNNFLNLAVSEDGWRVNKMIQMEGAAQGSPTVGDLVKRPGWLARHTTKRDFDQKAREEGKTVVE